MPRESLQDLGQLITQKLPPNHGFILVAVPFEGSHDDRLKYIANLRREDAINVLKEWLISASGPEEWMKHIV